LKENNKNIEYLTKQEFYDFLKDYEEIFDEQCERDNIN
jgi:uncharacterized membrane protein